jgi:hypothetical protein
LALHQQINVLFMTPAREAGFRFPLLALIRGVLFMVQFKGTGFSSTTLPPPEIVGLLPNVPGGQQ